MRKAISSYERHSTTLKLLATGNTREIFVQFNELLKKCTGTLP